MIKAVFGFFAVALLFIDKKSSLSYNESSTCHHKYLTELQLAYTERTGIRHGKKANRNKRSTG